MCSSLYATFVIMRLKDREVKKMQKYEMLILLNSEMTEEAREAELKKYADIVTSMGGNVEATDKWGVKKLRSSAQW